MPRYQAFSDRLSRLAPAFQALAEYWLNIIGVDLGKHREYIVDSCPIVPKVPVAHMQRVPANCVKKAITLLEMSGTVA